MIRKLRILIKQIRLCSQDFYLKIRRVVKEEIEIIVVRVNG